MSTIEFKAEELPSRGITYPEGTIFSVQMFTYGEVQDLNTDNLSVETKLRNFINATRINTNLLGENIAYIDYIYMHLSRVSAVYGNNSLRLPITCPFCGGAISETKKFDELEVNDISEYADIIPFKFDILGQEFTFNFLTLEKIVKWFKVIENIQRYEIFTELQKEHSEMKKQVDKLTPEDPNPVLVNKWEKLNKQFIELNGLMTKKNKDQAIKYKPYGYNALLLAFMCTTIGTEDFDIFLNKLNDKNLPSEILEYLDFVERTLGTGLKPIKANCPHCSKIFAYSLEDNVNDVYPFRQSSSDIANRLRALQTAKNASLSTEERGLQQDEDTVREPSERQGLTGNEQGLARRDETLSSGDEQEKSKINLTIPASAKTLSEQQELLRKERATVKQPRKSLSSQVEEIEKRSNLNNTGV